MPQKSQSSSASLEAGELLTSNPHWEAEEAEVGHQGRMVADLMDVLTEEGKGEGGGGEGGGGEGDGGEGRGEGKGGEGRGEGGEGGERGEGRGEGGKGREGGGEEGGGEGGGGEGQGGREGRGEGGEEGQTEEGDPCFFFGLILDPIGTYFYPREKAKTLCPSSQPTGHLRSTQNLICLLECTSPFLWPFSLSS
ncbi:hypothetical protein LEMLEM_LOCUS18827 [Lemmus lemmus]